MIFAFSPFRFRWPSEASRWLQEGLREPKMASKTAQDASRWLPTCSKRLQDRFKTGPSGHGASQGGPQEAQILQTPKENT